MAAATYNTARRLDSRKTARFKGDDTADELPKWLALI